MTIAHAPFKPITPTVAESTLARDSSRRLTGLASHDLRVQLPETHEEAILPAAAVQILVEALSEMAEGNAVALTAIHSELTTQQAADFLGVSRPFLVKAIDQGQLPHRKVGTHRRVLLRDLLIYKNQMEQKRGDTLGELAEQAQELDMGY